MRALRGLGADALVGCVAMAVAAANASVNWPMNAAERRTAVELAVVCGLAMTAVRRAPFPVVIVEAVLVLACGRWSPYTTATPIVLMVLAVGVLAHRARWATTIAGGLVVFAALLLHLAGGGVRGEMAWPGGVQVAGSLAFAVSPIAIGRYSAGMRRARLAAEERAAEVETRREMEIRAARLTERSRLARELHDIVAHHVGAMTLRAASGRLAATEHQDVAVATAALDDIAITGRQVLEQLRALLAVLRDSDTVGADPGEALVVEPEAALADAAARVRAAGVNVVSDVDARLAKTSILVRVTVARLVQEALTNVLKHAGPGVHAVVRVTVERSGEVRVLVANTGPARPATCAVLPGSGHGLTGMRERVSLLGGQFAAGPTGRFDWAVKATLLGRGNR